MGRHHPPRSKALYAFAEAMVPLITIITRKGYGGAFDIMSSRHIGADLVCAWPTAEIAVMGPDGAINIIFRKEIEAAKERKRRAELVKEYREKSANSHVTAGLGYIGRVIFPHEISPSICSCLEMLASKRKSRPPRSMGTFLHEPDIFKSTENLSSITTALISRLAIQGV